MVLECCNNILSLLLSEKDISPLFKVCISFKTVSHLLPSIIVAMETEIQKTSTVEVSRA